MNSRTQILLINIVGWIVFTIIAIWWSNLVLDWLFTNVFHGAGKPQWSWTILKGDFTASEIITLIVWTAAIITATVLIVTFIARVVVQLFYETTAAIKAVLHVSRRLFQIPTNVFISVRGGSNVMRAYFALKRFIMRNDSRGFQKNAGNNSSHKKHEQEKDYNQSQQRTTNSSDYGADKRHPDDAKFWAYVNDPNASDTERETAFRKIRERERNRKKNNE